MCACVRVCVGGWVRACMCMCTCTCVSIHVCAYACKRCVEKECGILFIHTMPEL